MKRTSRGSAKEKFAFPRSDAAMTWQPIVPCAPRPLTFISTNFFLDFFPLGMIPTKRAPKPRTKCRDDNKLPASVTLDHVRSLRHALQVDTT